MLLKKLKQLWDKQTKSIDEKNAECGENKWLNEWLTTQIYI